MTMRKNNRIALVLRLSIIIALAALMLATP